MKHNFLTFMMSQEDLEFSSQVCNLAQILAIHFGDNGDIEAKVSKARTFLRLVSVIPSRHEE